MHRGFSAWVCFCWCRPWSFCCLQSHQVSPCPWGKCCFVSAIRFLGTGNKLQQVRKEVFRLRGVSSPPQPPSPPAACLCKTKGGSKITFQCRKKAADAICICGCEPQVGRIYKASQIWRVSWNSAVNFEHNPDESKLDLAGNHWLFPLHSLI